MKRSVNDALARLLRNAALVKREPAGDLGFGVQARILAAWRQRQDEANTLLRMLRKAVLAAAAVSAVAVACTYAAVDVPEPRQEHERDILASVTNALRAIELSWIE